MPSKRTVVLGLLGPVLDNGRGTERWERWRPTVSLCQHEDLIVHRFELLYEPKFTALYETVTLDIARVSPETTVVPHLIDFKDPWDFEDVYAALHDFARAYPFKPDEEDYLVHITTGSHVAQICLFLLTESRFLPARLVQSAPPGKSRPDHGSYDIVDLDLSRYDRLASRFKEVVRESTSLLKSGIATRNAKFNRLIEQIEQVAVSSRAPITLTGPTGSGKSQLARRIYELKKLRRQLDGALIEVNCATIRGDGAMSTLFGHTRGAFTGSVGERSGLLRAADKGLLFLDEVGELGLDEQAMLLRAIEDKQFFAVGSDKPVRSDFQLIAGTNRDLQSEVRTGGFREDLYARMNLWTFVLPALRDRREDIEPNIEYELEQIARRQGKSVTFSKEAREQFLKFATAPDAAWNGNFRDLNAAVVRMCTFASGGRITREIVTEEIARLESSWRPAASEGSDDLAEVLDASALEDMDLFDRMQLTGVLRVCRTSRSLSDAGRKLFSASRAKKTTSNDADRLRKYLARFGLDWTKASGQARMLDS